MDEIQVRCGQPIEITLPGAIQWSLRVDDPDAILVPHIEQDISDKQGHRATWSFDTRTPGQATLIFSALPTASGGKTKTPLMGMAREYTIIVL